MLVPGGLRPLKVTTPVSEHMLSGSGALRRTPRREVVWVGGLARQLGSCVSWTFRLGECDNM